jgi:putative sugar O-methyltransferase
MLKIKHLAHPMRTAQIAKMRMRDHIQIRRFAAQSDARFQDDWRYQLHHVTNGFAPRIDDSSDDTEILRRICAAYARTIADQRLEPLWYEPTRWWKEIRRSSLSEVLWALQNGDTDALQRMYRNFFRDPCVAGLVGVPFGMWKAYFHHQMKDLHRRAYLGDTLYRLDYWNSRIGGSSDLHDLSGPNIGNPYGVMLSGTLVRYSAEYHHYCAHEILKLNCSRRVVAEIGGGYGALAYYLLRDGGKLAYVDFDVPESVALASYYLLKAFPSMNVTLYGEKELTEETIATSDVVLLPTFAMQKIPTRVVNVTFASHVLGDLAPNALAAYMNFVSRSTQDYFVYFGDESAVASISRFLCQSDRSCAPPQLRASDWNRHKAPDVREVEGTYRFTGQ